MKSRLFVIGAAFSALSAPALAKPVYVECTLASASGQPVPWRITLDEEAGSADVTIGHLRPDRTKATFYADHVRFYAGTMRMDLSRVDLTISRYSHGEDSPPNTAKCKLAEPPKIVF